jgi:hypothetical protein
MTILEIEEYLNDAIKSWRIIRDDEHHEYNEIAPYYIDAFQSVKSSLFGTTLPE